jgi:hypothetical protein
MVMMASQHVPDKVVGRFHATGARPICLDRLKAYGIHLSASNMLGARLRELRAHMRGRSKGASELLRREQRGTFAFLGDLVTWVAMLRRLQEMISQANLKYRAADVFGFSLALAGASFVVLGIAGATLSLLIWTGPELFRNQEDPLGDRLEALQSQAMVVAARAERRQRAGRGLDRFLYLVGLFPGGDDWMRGTAFNQFVRRTGIEDIKSLAAMIIQSEKFGTSLAQALKVYADALRTRRRLRSEAAVGKAGIKMLFPIVLFILPMLFVVTLVPGMLSVLRDLKLLGAGR